MANPQSFIQNIIAKNPKMNEVMQLLKMSKMTPKDFFYQYARQNGVDPDQFLNSIK